MTEDIETGSQRMRDADFSVASGGAAATAITTNETDALEERLAQKRANMLATVLRTERGKLIYIGWDEQGRPVVKDPGQLPLANREADQLFPHERRTVRITDITPVMFIHAEDAINFQDDRNAHRVAQDVLRLTVQDETGEQRELIVPELTFLRAALHSSRFSFQQSHIPGANGMAQGVPDPERLYTLLIPDSSSNGTPHDHATAVLFDPEGGSAIDFQRCVARGIVELLALDSMEGNRGYLDIARRMLPLKHSIDNFLGKNVRVVLDEKLTRQAKKVTTLMNKLAKITGRESGLLKDIGGTINPLLVEDLREVDFERFMEFVAALEARATEIFEPKPGQPTTVMVLDTEVLTGKPIPGDLRHVRTLDNQILPAFGYKWSDDALEMNVQLERKYFVFDDEGNPKLKPAYRLSGNAIVLKDGWIIEGSDDRPVLKEGWDLDENLEAYLLPGYVDGPDKAKLFV